MQCKIKFMVVEASNMQAINFYQKQGWLSKGLHPSYQDGILMEKFLSKLL